MAKVLAALGAVLLILQCVAAYQKVININNEVDRELVKLNKKLTDWGEGLQKVPDISLPRVRFSKGVQYGMNSLNRTGDCTVTLLKDGSMYIDYHIGYRLIVLAFGKISLHNGDEMSGSSRIRTNSFHMSFKLTRNQRECKVTLGYYKYEEMTEAYLQASLPKYDGLEVSRFIKSTFLPYVNKQLCRMRKTVEKMLQDKICPKEFDTDIIFSEAMPQALKIFAGTNVFSRLQDYKETDSDCLPTENLLL